MMSWKRMKKDAATPKFVPFATNLPKANSNLVMSVCSSAIEERDYHRWAFHENPIRVV